MTYVTGNLTTGSYDPSRLANTSLGHNAIDAGGAYTYLNPPKRHRAAGWNAWLTFAISPAAPGKAPPKAPLIRK